MEKQSTVFVSYNKNDRPWAEWIAWQLEEAGLKTIIQDWDFRGNWILEMNEAMKSDRTVIVLSKNYVEAEYTQSEWANAFAKDPRGIHDTLIPVKVGSVEPPPILSQIIYVDLVGLNEGSARERLLTRIFGNRGRPQEPPRFPSSGLVQPPFPSEVATSSPYSTKDSICPYQGLNHFTLETEGFFFGREVIIDTIISKLKVDNFVTVIGKSGSGKSSLFYAGVQPYINSSTCVRSFTPGSDPIGKIIGFSEEVLKKERAGNRKIQEVCSSLRKSGSSHSLMKAIDASSRYIIFIDQFEELFTLCSSKDEQQVFIDHLTTIASYKDFRLSIVIAIRADFIESCMEYEELNKLFTSQAVFVGPMVADDLKRVIKEPALKMGYNFQEGLITLIIDDICNANDSLPLLQFTLTQLWEKRNKETKRITLEDYTALGRVSGCLNACAEQMYNRLDQKEQVAVKSIFMRLIRTHDEIRDTKQKRSKESMLSIVGSSEIAKDEFDDLLHQLISSRLIVLDDSGHWIEMAHEALMEGWARFAKWRQEDRGIQRLVARIENAFDEWRANGCNSEYLVRGGLLTEIQQNFQRLNDILDGETLVFCKQSTCLYATEKELIDKGFASEMKALASLAKTRLAQADYKNTTVLRLYAETSQAKNMNLSGGNELAVTSADIHCGPPIISADLIWNCLLYARVGTEDVPWGQVFVNIDTCRSELLLDNRPEAWIGRPLIINDILFSKLKISDSSFTTVALQQLESAFSNFYMNKKHVRSFGGFLKDYNLRNFQKEYAKLRDLNDSRDVEELCLEAIAKTSFGRARTELGITCFDVWCDGSETVLIPEYGWRDVPRLVVVLDAKRPE